MGFREWIGAHTGRAIPIPAPNPQLEDRMLRVAAMIALLGWPSVLGRWFGVDKVKHFLMSALVQSTAYSASRVLGADHQASQVVGGSAVAGVGVLKEVYDRHVHKPFSIEDLVWDASGGVAAAALMNGTRRGTP
jgi:uncharacterized protein YfiM (DUF2279 family)